MIFRNFILASVIVCSAIPAMASMTLIQMPSSVQLVPTTLASNNPQFLREVPVKIKIKKHTYSVSSGRPEYAEALVCEKDGHFNLYQGTLEFINMEYSDITKVSCVTTFNNQDTQVSLGGFLYFIPHPTNVGVNAIKGFTTILSWGDYDKVSNQFYTSSFWTYDLALTSFMSSLAPVPHVECSSIQGCKPDRLEYFSGVIEALDQAL